MKPNSNKYKKFLVGAAIVFGILILGLYVYLNSSYRARVEHGIELPTRYSELETYGTFWQFWRKGVWHLSSSLWDTEGRQRWLCVPIQGTYGSLRRFGTHLRHSWNARVFEATRRKKTSELPIMLTFEAKVQHFDHEMYMIENSWKMILGFWTMSSQSMWSTSTDGESGKEFRWVGNGSKYSPGVFIAVIGLIIDEVFAWDTPHGPNPYNTKH